MTNDPRLEAALQAFRAHMETVYRPDVSDTPLAMAAALAAADRAAWQPIETAPRDGVPVLLWNGGRWIGVGYYHEPNYDDDPPWVDERSEYIEPPPTHWRPLPPTPGDEA